MASDDLETETREQAANEMQAARENEYFEAWWEAYRAALTGLASIDRLSTTYGHDEAINLADSAETAYRARSLQRDKRVAELFGEPPKTRHPGIIR